MERKPVKLILKLWLFLLCASLLLIGCKLTIVAPEGGRVVAESGAFICTESSSCTVDIVDLFFEETFVAVPAQGYRFQKWVAREYGFCGNTRASCYLTTKDFSAFEVLMALLESDDEFYLEAQFATAEERLGFELIEVISPTEQRAWVSPTMTREQFDALELPSNWFKNQPRQGDSDSSRFLRSPDGEADGDLLFQPNFGFPMLHVATITEEDITLDDQGLLRGTQVRKYHEITYYPGSTMVVLVSPDGEPYFRLTRDADRTSEEPTIPEDWLLVEYTVTDKLVIELFESNLVIRTDNQDSFQGPVPELAALLNGV